MEESDKLPLKRVEISLTKFNEVAIPHHLDLLRQHKANILKYEEEGAFTRVRSEQRHAGRVTSQLRALLAELDALRGRVREEDRTRFDAITQRARDNTLAAIVDYLGVIERSCRSLVLAAQAQIEETSPLSINRESARCVAGSAVSTDSVGLVPDASETEIQLQIDEHEVALREREAVLEGWSELQQEVRDLHETWRHVHDQALLQREQVSASAAAVETASENVSAARKHLAVAEKFRVGMYGAGGAVLGALSLGPLGLALGAKAGAAAALAGTAAGYLGARALGARRGAQIDAAAKGERKDQ